MDVRITIISHPQVCPVEGSYFKTITIKGVDVNHNEETDAFEFTDEDNDELVASVPKQHCLIEVIKP